MNSRPFLRIRNLRLVVNTNEGRFERSIPFADGLNILRADNTSGKSTALLSIIFALGLEGMISPSKKIPLAHVMTEYVGDMPGRRVVDRSWVELTAEGVDGQSVVIRRSVVDPERDSDLVSVTRILPKNSNLHRKSDDYFVRRSGSAVNDRGFHRFLAEFIGLKLPRVSKNDGSEVLLYLETVFPNFFVEQKRGWTGIQNRVPNYFGIKDVGAKSLQFVLKMDSLSREVTLQRIRSAQAELESDWKSTWASLQATAKASGVALRSEAGRISDRADKWDLQPTVYIRNQWMPLDEGVEQLRADVFEMRSREVPPLGPDVAELSGQIAGLEGKLRTCIATAAAASESREVHERLFNQTSLRVESLEVDLAKHKDAATVEKLGSRLLPELLGDHVCPACHQQVQDGFELTSNPMSVDQSISFIGKQLVAFRALADEYKTAADAFGIKRRSLDQEIAETRKQIRALRESVSMSSKAPSVAQIEKRLLLENRAESVVAAKTELVNGQEALSKYSEQWAQLASRRKELSAGKPSAADDVKVSDLQGSVQAQLVSYQFESIVPSAVEIDMNSLRPVNSGFDLGLDLSASDLVRVIWAHVVGLLEVGMVRETNHVGLLVLDEPRQQDASPASYRALLRRLSSTSAQGAQVIVATSEPAESLSSMLEGCSFAGTVLAPGEKLLQPVDW